MIIQYDKLTTLNLDDLPLGTFITVVFNKNTSIMTQLVVEENENKVKCLSRIETYDSIKEFSTVAMKELLTLYAKRTIIASDPIYYKHDDPKLHAYLSKLSYPGIETVCMNLTEFAKQFKEGTVTINIPKFNKKNPTKKN